MNDEEIKSMIAEFQSAGPMEHRALLLLCREIERTTRHRYRDSIQAAVHRAYERENVRKDLDELEMRRFKESKERKSDERLTQI